MIFFVQGERCGPDFILLWVDIRVILNVIHCLVRSSANLVWSYLNNYFQPSHCHPSLDPFARVANMSYLDFDSSILLFLHFDPQNQSVLLKCWWAATCSPVGVTVHFEEKVGDSVLSCQLAAGEKDKKKYNGDRSQKAQEWIVWPGRQGPEGNRFTVPLIIGKRFLLGWDWEKPWSGSKPEARHGHLGSRDPLRRAENTNLYWSWPCTQYSSWGGSSQRSPS